MWLKAWAWNCVGLFGWMQRVWSSAEWMCLGVLGLRLFEAGGCLWMQGGVFAGRDECPSVLLERSERLSASFEFFVLFLSWKLISDSRLEYLLLALRVWPFILWVACAFLALSASGTPHARSSTHRVRNIGTIRAHLTMVSITVQKNPFSGTRK